MGALVVSGIEKRFMALLGKSLNSSLNHKVVFALFVKSQWLKMATQELREFVKTTTMKQVS
jgi:predicted solute-binding protein